MVHVGLFGKKMLPLTGSRLFPAPMPVANAQVAEVANPDEGGVKLKPLFFPQECEDTNCCSVKSSDKKMVLKHGFCPAFPQIS